MIEYINIPYVETDGINIPKVDNRMTLPCWYKIETPENVILKLNNIVEYINNETSDFGWFSIINENPITKNKIPEIHKYFINPVDGLDFSNVQNTTKVHFNNLLDKRVKSLKVSINTHGIKKYTIELDWDS